MAKLNVCPSSIAREMKPCRALALNSLSEETCLESVEHTIWTLNEHFPIDWQHRRTRIDILCSLCERDRRFMQTKKKMLPNHVRNLLWWTCVARMDSCTSCSLTKGCDESLTLWRRVFWVRDFGVNIMDQRVLDVLAHANATITKHSHYHPSVSFSQVVLVCLWVCAGGIKSFAA